MFCWVDEETFWECSGIRRSCYRSDLGKSCAIAFPSNCLVCGEICGGSVSELGLRGKKLCYRIERQFRSDLPIVLTSLQPKGKAVGCWVTCQLNWILFPFAFTWFPFSRSFMDCPPDIDANWWSFALIPLFETARAGVFSQRSHRGFVLVILRHAFCHLALATYWWFFILWSGLRNLTDCSLNLPTATNQEKTIQEGLSTFRFAKKTSRRPGEIEATSPSVHCSGPEDDRKRFRSVTFTNKWDFSVRHLLSLVKQLCIQDAESQLLENEKAWYRECDRIKISTASHKSVAPDLTEFRKPKTRVQEFRRLVGPNPFNPLLRGVNPFRRKTCLPQT
jgi:hypothetical protein